MSNYLFISDAAKEVKVESHVLRYWEEELHLPIKRNELGHRYYTEEDVERFKQIKSMKERGLQLKAIKMILKDGKLDVLSTEETGIDNSMGQNPAEPVSEMDIQIPQTQMPEMSMPYGRMSGTKAQDTRGSQAGMAIDIISTRENFPPRENFSTRGKEAAVQETKEDKSRRLQWLLQQLIRQTLQENNMQLCREIRDSVVKELDYQFRMQEERDEARDRMLAERDEEHFKRMDELLRKKSRGLKKRKWDREEDAAADKKDRGKRKQERSQLKKQDENQDIVIQDYDNEQERNIQEGEIDGQAAPSEKKKRRFF